MSKKNIKKIGIKQDTGEYAYVDIGVDANNVDIDETTNLIDKLAEIDTKADNNPYYMTTSTDGYGSEGYVAFARLEVKSSYQNSPIEFELICRGRKESCRVSIQFEGSSANDPAIKALLYTGADYGVFARKINTSIWELYYTKSENYDLLTVTRISHVNGLAVEITHPGTYLSTKPTTTIVNASLGCAVASAETAIKATQDGDGNVIAETYAKKASILSSVAECEASTNTEDIAGASAISELQESKSNKSIYGDEVLNLGRRASTTAGVKSATLGSDLTASGDYSFACGYNVYARGKYSQAFGASVYNTQKMAAEVTTSEGENSVAMGRGVKAVGNYSFAIGRGEATGQNVVDYTMSEGVASVAMGHRANAIGDYSQAFGTRTKARTNQMAIGHLNDYTKSTENSTSGTSTGTAFVIGNGNTTSGVPSNAFRVTGEGVTYAKGNYNSTGADYAEYFEWQDGNADNEDRVGYFVTFADGKYIKKASEGDYILGIVSGMPCVIGNSDECWQKQFEMDDFGRFIYENQKYIEAETGEEKECTFYKVNPDYDPAKPYEHRENRPEWSAIGMMGVLSVRDDGTCEVNGYCKCSSNGIATACERGLDTFRVIERVTNNIVKVVIK